LERLHIRTALSCRPRVQGTPGPTQSSPACQVARAHAVRACLRRITKLSARISVDYGAQSRRVLTIRARYFFRWGPSPISTLRPPLLSERRPFGAGNAFGPHLRAAVEPVGTWIVHRLADGGVTRRRRARACLAARIPRRRGLNRCARRSAWIATRRRELASKTPGEARRRADERLECATLLPSTSTFGPQPRIGISPHHR